MHMPVILGCLVSVLLCVFVLFLRRVLFWHELRRYKKYIALATAPSIVELRNKLWYEGKSACSKVWCRREDELRRGCAYPSWHEIDKYRIESHIGTSPYGTNSGKRKTDELEEDCWISFNVNFRDAVKSGIDVSDAFNKGLKGYLSAERGEVSRYNYALVSDKYIAKKDYQKMASWGYLEDEEWVFYTNPSRYVLYCSDIIERNGLPCLLLSGSSAGQRKTKGGRYQGSLSGLLSYPLRGIKMEEALRFRGRMLLVDGVEDRLDSVKWYCWQEVELIRRGIVPYETVAVDKYFNPTMDWKATDKKGEFNRIKKIDKLHDRYVRRYGSSWTKKDTMVRIGYVQGWKTEDVPRDMRVSERSADLWSEKKDILIPNFDIYRIRVTPFTFDGVVSFKDYVKYGCPVYDFSMYGCRLSGRYNRSRHMVERGQMVDEQWQDRTCFEDLYAVKVTEEQLSNVDDLQRKE